MPPLPRPFQPDDQDTIDDLRLDPIPRLVIIRAHHHLLLRPLGKIQVERTRDPDAMEPLHWPKLGIRILNNSLLRPNSHDQQAPYHKSKDFTHTHKGKKITSSIFSRYTPRAARMQFPDRTISLI